MNRIHGYRVVPLPSTQVASVPRQIGEGVFGATCIRNNEAIFLRMEKLTQDNADKWDRFKRMNSLFCNDEPNCISLKTLVEEAENGSKLERQTKEFTGFGKKEYDAFVTKAIDRKKQTAGKIVDFLAKNHEGSGFIDTEFDAQKTKFIAYASKTPDFSIQRADRLMLSKSKTLKTYIRAYGDILISMGSDFSERESFHNRGISRNPHWVFEGEHAGLSMLLQGFTGAVAADEFPEKKMMQTRPVGAMQCIFKKHLQRGEGSAVDLFDQRTVDMVDLSVLPTDPEHSVDLIKIAALTRIYQKEVALFGTRDIASGSRKPLRERCCTVQ